VWRPACQEDFASEKEIKDFFEKHGDPMSWLGSFPLLEEHESKVQALRSALIPTSGFHTP